MKKAILIPLISLSVSVALLSCNKNGQNGSSTGNEAQSKKISPDNRNDNNVNPGDRHDENTLQNETKGSDTGAEIKDSAKTSRK